MGGFDNIHVEFASEFSVLAFCLQAELTSFSERVVNLWLAYSEARAIVA